MRRFLRVPKIYVYTEIRKIIYIPVEPSFVKVGFNGIRNYVDVLHVACCDMFQPETGEVNCSRLPCPVLDCPQSQRIRRNPDDCCQACQGNINN